MSEEKPFYVYVHRRATDGLVFYVGKGKGNRLNSKSRTNPYWHNVVNKHGFTAHIVMRFYNEKCAFSLEKAIIKLYGRDSLCNLTDGGDGPSGYKATNQSRIHTSRVMKDKWEDDKYREVMKKSMNSPETKARKSSSIKKSLSSPYVVDKLSKSAIIQWSNDEMRKRMSLAMSASKGGYEICKSDGLTFKTYSQAVDWLKANGYPRASPGTLHMAVTGKRKVAYGSTWSKKDGTKN